MLISSITHNNNGKVDYFFDRKVRRQKRIEAALAKEISKMCFTTESKGKAEKCSKFMPWAPGMIRTPLGDVGSLFQRTSKQSSIWAGLPCPAQAGAHGTSPATWESFQRATQSPEKFGCWERQKYFWPQIHFSNTKRFFHSRSLITTFQTSIIRKHSSMTTLNIKLSPCKQTHVSHSFFTIFPGVKSECQQPFKETVS